MERVTFVSERCKGCRLCITACPQDALALSATVNGAGYHYAYLSVPDRCISCGLCGVVCPDQVISVYAPERAAV